MLASCSSLDTPDVADERAGGVPGGWDSSFGGEELTVIAAEDGSVQVITWGSSSCAPTATSIEIDSTELVVTFEGPTSDPCSADMAPTTHTFSADTVGAVVPDIARVIFLGSDVEYVVEVISG